jgi:hypothetical protein
MFFHPVNPSTLTLLPKPFNEVTIDTTSLIKIFEAEYSQLNLVSPNQTGITLLFTALSVLFLSYACHANVPAIQSFATVFPDIMEKKLFKSLYEDDSYLQNLKNKTATD